jgi:DNA modification methylase
MPDESIDLVVTSPPYPGQKGNDQTVGEWLEWFDKVLWALYRVMKPSAVLALNLMFKRVDGWFDRRLFAIPNLLLLNHLQLIDVYIYGKTNPVPNGPLSYCDPPGWEPVFVATKANATDAYTFNPYREPYREKSINGNGGLYTTRSESAGLHPDGARQTNLMLLSSSGDQNRPKAVGQSFPLALPERFVLQHTRPGDLVLDPCVGVGTTCKAAQKHGRRWLGIEINPYEAQKARDWLAEPYIAPLFATEAP